MGMRVRGAGVGLVGLLAVGFTTAVSVPAAGTAPPPTVARVGQTVTAVSTPPPGFSDEVVATVNAPTGLTWTPDRRMVVIGKAGRVIVIRPDGRRTVALDLTASVCDQGERGLIGVAVDPAFGTNRLLYLNYTHEVRGQCGEAGPKPANRVRRWVLGDDDKVVPGSGHTLLDHIVSPQPNHLGGDLEFGSDGLLYVSVGDGVCSLVDRSRCGPTNDNSQLRRFPHGKILRVDRRGLPASTNPYVSRPGSRRCTRPAGVPSGTGPCREIFATGFRNPFRMARRPGTSDFFVNDVGLRTWEEVDHLGKGRNYGWNVREGNCRRGSTTDCGVVAPFTNPVHSYLHDECRSITGGAFVPAGLWPGFDGSYLYADFGCGRIFRLVRNADGGFTRSVFLTGAEGPVHLRFGPAEGGRALYYLSFFTNTVHRVSRVSTNTAPVADFTSRPNGRDVTLSGAASTDPDSGDQVVSWRWDFGDGTTQTSDVPRVTHTYAADGPFEVSLTVTDSHGLTSPTVTKTVHSGEHPPAIAITQPSTEARFSVNQTVNLAAAATDIEDGQLPGASITWVVRRRHANHFHPHLGPVSGASVSTTYPPPEELAATGNTWLVATVTATDSKGHTTTVHRRLLPRTVELTFRTSPRGGRVVLQGVSRATPAVVLSWHRYVFAVSAPDQHIDGRRYVFSRWSDGKARRHNIVTPREAQDYTAFFVRP